MAIKEQTRRGARILICLVVAAITISSVAIYEIRVGGPVHRENQLQSDLTADILPPPTYIIEPYLQATIAVEDQELADHADQLRALRKVYEERKSFWQNSVLDDPLKQQMAVTNKSADAFWTEIDANFLPAIERGDFVAAKRSHDGQLSPLYVKHRTDIDKLVAMTSEAQQKLAVRSQWLIMGSLIVLVLVAVTLVYSIMTAARRLRRQVIRPIEDTAEEMRRMTAGDFDVHVSGLDRADEIGDMAKAMEIFRDAGRAKARAEAEQQQVVTDLGHGLRELATGNLAHRIDQPFAAEYEDLRTRFNGAIQDLGVTLARVLETSSNVDAGAGEIRAASDDLSQRTEQQAASLEESAAAMDKITAMVKETAQSADRVTTAISDAHREASEGGVVVEKAVDAMSAIEKSAQEITQIINVIDGIAFQTNLLALNAGVEAARAGDAGKGFAVVANEVRALAQRSAEAAKDIKDLINTSAQQVEQGVGLVGETGSMLTRIVTRVTEVNELIGGIAKASGAQARHMEQVNASVSDMDKMTQQNAAMVEETTAAARSLASEAKDLKELVARFRVAGRSEVQAAPRIGQQSAIASVSRIPAQAGNLALADDADDWDEF